MQTQRHRDTQTQIQKHTHTRTRTKPRDCWERWMRSFRVEFRSDRQVLHQVKQLEHFPLDCVRSSRRSEKLNKEGVETMKQTERRTKSLEPDDMEIDSDADKRVKN